MTETFKCPACGAANNLADGKTSMPCTYCGASIHLPQGNYNTRNDKPRLSKIAFDDDRTFNKLSYVDRNISSLEQVIEIYSDNELGQISTLNLSKNKIKSVNGLQRFSLRDLDLSFNDIEVIDQLPDMSSSFTLSTKTLKCSINLSDNKVIKGFSENMIAEINSYTHINGFELKLFGCDNFDLAQFSKLNFSKFIFENSYSQIVFWLDTSRPFPDVLQRIGFQAGVSNPTRTMWAYPAKPATTAKADSSQGNCFIATAATGSYDHPNVLELRSFRDEWILTKPWGNAFVSWYYHYGAICAEFIGQSIILKKLSMWFIVRPLLFLSRMLK